MQGQLPPITICPVLQASALPCKNYIRSYSNRVVDTITKQFLKPSRWGIYRLYPQRWVGLPTKEEFDNTLAEHDIQTRKNGAIALVFGQ